MLEKNQIKFMREAIALSQENVNNEGGPFGAIIVKDDKIVGRGVNRVTQEMDPTAHAEINAIRDACKNLGTYSLEGCEIYTSCEPCPMCLGAIYWAHIGTIYYGNNREDAALIGFDDQFIYDEISKPVVLRTIPLYQVMAHEAIEAFGMWQTKEDKQVY